MESSALPLPDRAFELGDSLFETCRLLNGAIPFFSLHWQRLRHGCEVLGFPDCSTTLQEQLHGVIACLGGRGFDEAVIRITVSRGEAPRGYLSPERATPRIIVYATPPSQTFAQQAAAASIGLASMRLGAQPALAGIKHGSRLEQVLAADERRAADSGEPFWDEMLLCDYNGRPHSLISANLFAVIDGEIVTPPIVDCGIAGTRRQLLLNTLAPMQEIAAHEEFFTMAELTAAQEVFCANSVQGFRPVARLHDCQWHEHPVCDALHTAYTAAAYAEVAV
ncbi:MAG: aminotransferase class IV [Halioglobus sp.]